MNLRTLFLLSLNLSAVGLFAQQEQHVTFNSGSVQLAGTITVQDSIEIKSLAVLISVAGPTDGDLTLGAHKYFKKLARGLSEYGIATIRYDARGMGGSSGDLLETTLEDRASDVLSAMQHLASAFPEVKNKGFIGMSEGGGLAALASLGYNETSFVVMLSSPVRSGKEVMMGQLKRQIPRVGFPAEKQKSIIAMSEEFLESISAEVIDSAKVLAILKGPNGSILLPPYSFVPRRAEEQLNFVLSPWYQSQVRFNIERQIQQLEIPVLALYGENDKALDPSLNAEKLMELYPSVDLRVIPKLNHLMQESVEGWPTEYLFLPESFSDEAIAIIGEWTGNLGR